MYHAGFHSNYRFTTSTSYDVYGAQFASHQHPCPAPEPVDEAVSELHQRLDALAASRAPSTAAPYTAPQHPPASIADAKDDEIAVLRAELAAMKQAQAGHEHVAPVTPDTLKLVLIVHRHGARFPTKQLGGDICWPASKQFWDDFKAQLTPTGAVQHNRLGELLGKRYEGLFADLSTEQINDVVRVHTSNYQRTLFSAWSFLQGMFPEVPRYFNYLSDRQDVDMEQLNTTIEAQGGTLGIPIHIETNASDDYMFHQIKADTTSQHARDFEDGGAASKSAAFQAMDSDSEYVALCEKLFRITGKKALLQPGARICKLKSVFTQIEIAKTHGLPILPNKCNEVITAREVEMIEEAATVVMKYMFRPADSNRVADGIGIDSAGYLGNEIARVITEKMHNDSASNKLRFVEYSCHDSTCLALASLLGLDVQPPGFTAHFLFEVHHDPAVRNDSDGWYVNVVWNGDPPTMTDHEIVTATPRALPLNNEYATYSELPVGGVDADKITDYLTIESMKASALALKKIQEWSLNKEQGKFVSMHAAAEAHRQTFSTEEEERVTKAFDFYDENQDGCISATELNTAFRRFGMEKISHDDVVAVLSALEKDQNGSLSIDEFLVFMSFFKSLGGEPKRPEDSDMDSDEE